jgi:hypothetical protein
MDLQQHGPAGGEVCSGIQTDPHSFDTSDDDSNLEDDQQLLDLLRPRKVLAFESCTSKQLLTRWYLLYYHGNQHWRHASSLDQLNANRC